MARTEPAAVVFDAYGTLLDVHSGMQRHADRVGPNWPEISAVWRAKQLEYTWIRSLSGPAQHRDFAELTDLALDFTAAKFNITDAALLHDLRRAYWELQAYPEAAAALQSLQDRGIRTAILSNGSPKMLHSGVDHADLDRHLDAVLSVESVGVFKPDQRIYQLAHEHFGTAYADMVFVSSNAWDAFGAHCAGMRVVWVNRSQQPVEYRLDKVATIIGDLSQLEASIA